MGKILFLYGPSGCGKTTIAQKVLNFIDGVRLDGDEMRKSISKDLGFSPEDRNEHNLRVARLAKIISAQTNVIVCLITPLQRTRNKIDELCSPMWAYLEREVPEREGHIFEEADRGITIDNQNQAIEDTAKVVRGMFEEDKPAYAFFPGRWQCIPPHAGHLGLFEVARERGEKICIGVRDTKVDEKNPYSMQERIKALKEAVPDAKVIPMPDITSVYYGRGVGYKVEQLELSKDVQAISGTKMREQGKG